jgi:hypothetical protein
MTEASPEPEESPMTTSEYKIDEKWLLLVCAPDGDRMMGVRINEPDDGGKPTLTYYRNPEYSDEAVIAVCERWSVD